MEEAEGTQLAFNALLSRRLYLMSARPQRRNFRDQVVSDEELKKLDSGVVNRQRVRPDALY